MSIETVHHNSLTATIDHDCDAESPREWDNLGTMACFHRRYLLGDKHSFKTPDDLHAHLARTPHVALPLYLYDHSGITMNTTGFSCPWDSGQVGYIFITHEQACKEFGWKRISKLREEFLRQVMLSEVSVYDQYIRGEVYAYAIENENGETIDSCCGFFGLETAVSEARQALGIDEA